MSVDLTRECEKLRERLPEYAEGRLEGRLRARVERHVSGCPRCAAEVDDLRTVIAAVRAVGPEETPEDLIPRVRRVAQERVPAPAGAGLFWPRLAVPMAVLTVLVAATFALRAPRQRAFVPGAGDMESAARVRGVTPGESKQLADEMGGEPGFEIAQKMEAAEGVAGPMADQPAPLSAREDKASSYFGHQAAPPPAAASKASEQLDTTADVREGEAARSFDTDGTAAARMGKGRLRGPAEGWPKESVGRAGGAGRGGGEGMRGPCARGAESEALAGAREEPAEAPPLSARAALVSGAGGKLIALQLAAEQTLGEIKLRLGDASPKVYAWHGRAGGPAWIPLTADTIGAGPAAISIELRAGDASRDYVLFVPMMARLGESAPAAPVGGYGGQSLEAVLAEFTALTGLVVLAERPLAVTMKGEMPRGKPGEALEQVAAEAGFEAHREGDLVYTLTHRR
jgi:hypothetical protein